MNYCDKRDVWFCSSDYDDHTDENDSESFTREFTVNPAWISTKHGDIVPAIAKVGIELECVALDENDTSSSVPIEVGVTNDGSISGNGLEIVTPPAQGKGFEKMVDAIVKGLRDSRVKINRSCGFHVHIDGTMLEEKTRRISLLLASYLAYEDVIMSFLPPSRRTNNYSHPLRAFAHLDEIVRLGNENRQGLEELWYRDSGVILNQRKHGKYDDTRYRGLNLHSFFHSGNYEIRYHSGTINPEKIKYWVSLHLLVLKAACDAEERNGLNTVREFQNAITETSLEMKTSQFFDYIQAPLSLRNFYAKRQGMFNSMSKDVRKFEAAELNENEDMPVERIAVNQVPL